MLMSTSTSSVMRIIAGNWENNSNKIKELENRIIAKIWSIIISSLVVGRGEVMWGGEWGLYIFAYYSFSGHSPHFCCLHALLLKLGGGL